MVLFPLFYEHILIGNSAIVFKLGYYMRPNGNSNPHFEKSNLETWGFIMGHIMSDALFQI